MTATPEQFVAEARSYLGCPWRHQGRTKQGIDCVGLIVSPLITLGVLRPEDDVHDYKRDPEGRRLVEMLHKYARRLENISEAAAGDLIAMRFTTEPQHLAIVSRIVGAKWIHILHAAGQGNAVVEHLLDDKWLKGRRAKIHAAFRIKAFDQSQEQFDAADLAGLGCGCGD